MYIEFKGVTYEDETIISNSIIQKEMPYGLDIRLYVEGQRWVRIKNETLKINNNNSIINDLFSLWDNLAECGEISIGKGFNEKYNNLKQQLK